jgi:23S rRNA pseudouridine1911/1915/1917 synthase
VPRKEFFVTPEWGADERLDVFLAGNFPEFTRSQFQRFIDRGCVEVNGAFKKSSIKLRTGDRVAVDIEIPESAGIIAEDIPLKILTADNDVIVIDKPSGLVVHPGAGARRGTLVNALLHHFPEIKGLGGEERPGIVHRLDKETSGVMVIARSRRAYEELQRQFKAREVKKVYLALVWGRLPGSEGRFDWPIGRHVKHGQRMSIKTRKPRAAVTDYRILKESRLYSLLEVSPITGRTHQIRVHLSAAGHPLVGDRRYGPSRSPKRMFPRLFLHAHRLSFCHPGTARPVAFVSPLPDDLAMILKSIEWNSSPSV